MLAVLAEAVLPFAGVSLVWLWLMGVLLAMEVLVAAWLPPVPAWLAVVVPGAAPWLPAVETGAVVCVAAAAVLSAGCPVLLPCAPVVADAPAASAAAWLWA